MANPEDLPPVSISATPKQSFISLGRICAYFKDPEHVLVFKLDVFLLVWAFIAGLMKDMDQSATTAAYVSGMQESLSLYGNELVEFTTYFSIGYAIFIVPSQLAQTRVRPSLWLPTCEIIWGALTLATFAAKNAKTVYALRFFLGVFEATSWPGIVNLIFNWYKPSELGKRLAIFGVSGVAGNMFLGVVQAALYKNLNGVHGLQGWQWLFIVSGIITMVWGVYGLFVIPDSPSTTRALWLSSNQKSISGSRMAEVGTKTQELIKGKALWKKIKAMVRNPITYLFVASYLQFAWSQRSNSYFLLYLKSLTKDNGDPLYSVYTVNLIPLGGYAISIVANIALNALSDWKGWRLEVAVATAVLQLISTAVLSAWPDDRATVMAFYFLTFATAAWGSALLSWLGVILSKEPEARSITVGATVTLVYVGHATIPLRAWRVEDSPSYPIGFPLSAAFSAGSIITMLGMEWYVRKNPQLLEYGMDWKQHVEPSSKDSSDEV